MILLQKSAEKRYQTIKSGKMIWLSPNFNYRSYYQRIIKYMPSDHSDWVCVEDATGALSF